MVLGEGTSHKVHVHWGLIDHGHMVFVSLVSRAVGLQEELGQFLWNKYSLSYLYAGILPKRAHTSYLSNPVSSALSALLSWGFCWWPRWVEGLTRDLRVQQAQVPVSYEEGLNLFLFRVVTPVLGSQQLLNKM